MSSLLAPSRWVIVAVLTLSFVQAHIHRVGFAPLIPTFIAELGLTYAAAGALMTAYFWTYTAAQIPIGVLTDRWGSRRVMIVFMAVLAVGAVAFPLSQSYAQSLLARSLVGLGAAAVWVPGIRLIAEWFPPRERGRATGIFSAGAGIGGTLGLLAIPFLADRWGWRLGYASTVLPVLLTLTLIVLLVRGTDGQGDGSEGRPATEGRHPSTGSSRGRGALGALRQVLTNRAVWPLGVAMLLFNGGYFSLLTWTPVFVVRQLGATQSEAGSVTSLITAAHIISWPLLGFLTDRLGRRKLVIQMSLMSACLVSLTFAWVVPSLSLWGAGAIALTAGLFMGGMILPTVMAVELFPRELAGTVTSVVNTFFFIGALTIPVLLGRLVDLTGSLPHAFVATAAVQALALVAAAFIRDSGQASRPGTEPEAR